MFTDEKACQKPWHRLFERLLSDLDERQGSESDNAETRLPSSVYTSPERYQAEVSTLFRRLPLCLGHVDQLATRSVMACDIVGLPLLLARDADGEVHVLLNACRHRGARLLTDDAVRHRNSLSCLYHGWTYGLDGRLLNMPRREAFPTCDPAAHGLRKLPSTVRHGLIWAVLDPHSDKQPNVATYLAGLDDDMVELGISGHRFFRQNSVLRKTNWKLVIDAFVEFYHIKRLHASTIGQFFADTKAASESVGPHLRMLVARDGFEGTRQLPPEQWSPRHHASLVHFIFPNSIVVQHPDYISHMAVFPAAIDQSLFVHTVLTPEPPADEKAQAHWDRSFDLMDGQVFNNEDLFICEQIQLGLPAMESGEFVLGRFENNVHRFHETIVAALSDIES